MAKLAAADREQFGLGFEPDLDVPVGGAAGFEPDLLRAGGDALMRGFRGLRVGRGGEWRQRMHGGGGFGARQNPGAIFLRQKLRGMLGKHDGNRPERGGYKPGR